VQDEERRARLAARHDLLSWSRTDDLPQIADDLVALHSSDPVTVYLSLLARMRQPSIDAVERALYEDRSLIRHHAMRRTLWVATPPVARLMHAAATATLVQPEIRRTAKLLAAGGIAQPDAWLAAAQDEVVDDLIQHGPSTARELGARVAALRHPLQLAAGTPWAATQSAHTRVLLLLGFQGRIVRARPVGSWVNGAYRYAAADHWLPGGLGSLDPGEAATELAHRWLLRFGPGLAADLQWWTGWTKTVTTRALAACGAVELDLCGRPGWLAPDDLGSPAPEPWVAVLPSLDPTTMGWKDRGWYLPAAAAAAFDRNGNAGPTIWVDGRVVGAWAQTRAGELRTHYFERVAAVRRRQVQERLDALAAAVGQTRFTVRFPGAVQARILAEE
jgi:hypothetical protein